MAKRKTKKIRMREQQAAYVNGLEGFKKSIEDCKDKVSYTRRAEATAMGRYHKQRVYFCQYCRRYHLSSS